MTDSRIPGFYNMSLQVRRDRLPEAAGLSRDDLGAYDRAGGLEAQAADHMIENVVGTFALPVGIALNFRVNGRDVFVPMVIEEPSVVAGASFMAKLARTTGGFFATSSPPEMIGQMQLLGVANAPLARAILLQHRDELLAQADTIDPVLKKLGGGARDLEVRIIEDSPLGAFVVLHLIYDVRDAMGANAVNTACEKLAPRVEALTGGRVHLRILSNLADHRLARARCTIPVGELAFDDLS
jgi:hydroxymethylglutaryl-CoA reductase